MVSLAQYMLDDADSSATASSAMMRDEGADEPTPLPSNLRDVEIGALHTPTFPPRSKSQEFLPNTFEAARVQRLRRWQSVDPVDVIEWSKEGVRCRVQLAGVAGERDSQCSTPRMLSRATPTHEHSESAQQNKSASVRRALEKSVTLGLHAEVTRSRNGEAWQTDPPHLLQYNVSELHNFGWAVPCRRKIITTVLTNAGLWLKGMLLAAWTATIHQTGGLGVASEDQHDFVSVFGTTFMGSIWNLATIVTFILGLFITLVVQRWWELRTTVRVCALHPAAARRSAPPTPAWH